MLWTVLAFSSVLLASNEDRVKALQDKFLSPCCWSESVLRHQSETAVEMRNEIASLVQAGKSDRAIVDTFIARHGRRILREPEGTASWVLNSVLLAVLALAVCVVVVLIRRWRSRPPRLDPQPANVPDIPDDW
jgi:cytochrome c-type biogenesis protein CcmH/NrfF